MPKHSQPRRGSLQYWPRKRARKILPSVNWKPLSEKPGLLGFIAYKVGMKSATVKDNTNHSLTKGKKIAVPVTVLECPPLKILSVRFYKQGKIIKEIFAGGDKELKRKIRLAKKQETRKVSLEGVENYDSIRVIVYSLVARTGIKKTPDLAEIALGGSKDEQLNFIKNFVTKEIIISDVFTEGLIDSRGVTKGKGTQGPVKRYGISLRPHKSEKGVRKVGSIGPWHPPRVTFRVPMAGQMGFFTRISYNSQVIDMGKISEKNINPKGGWKHYGNIKTNYIILKGSVPGPSKRQLLLTPSLRAGKKQLKKDFEFVDIK